jgi:DNA-binding MltR family transcriptional regulator
MAWVLNEHIPFDAVKEFAGQNPRASAIVGAAILEAQLSKIIENQFRDGDTKTELFKETGPLGTYDAKIKMAYTLGVVSKMAYNDLVLIGRIRNKFAHRLDIGDFTHPIIKPMCEGLKLVDTIVFELGSDPPDNLGIETKFFEPDLTEKRQRPGDRYVISVRIITSTLVSRVMQLTKPTFPRALI